MRVLFALNFKQVDAIVTNSKWKKCLKCFDALWIIWSHKAAPLPPSFIHAHTHTHRSTVNIPPKQTQVQTWKSVEGFRHTLGLSVHPSSYTVTFCVSVAKVCDDRSPFLHYLSDEHRRSSCASRMVLSMPHCLSISPMFPSGVLLWSATVETVY